MKKNGAKKVEEITTVGLFILYAHLLPYYVIDGTYGLQRK